MGSAGFEEAEQIKIMKPESIKTSRSWRLTPVAGDCRRGAGYCPRDSTEVRRSLDYHDLQLQGRRDDAVSRVALEAGRSSTA